MREISLILILIFSTWDLRFGYGGLSIGQMSIFLYLTFNINSFKNIKTIYNLIIIILIISFFTLSDLALGGSARFFEAANSIIFLAIQLIAGAVFLTRIKKLSDRALARCFLLVIAFFCSLAFLDTIFRIALGTTLVYVPGGNLSDLSFFSNDPNWPAVLVATLSFYVVLIFGGHRAALALGLTTVVVFYTGSRAAQIVWLLSFVAYSYQQSESKRVLLTFTIAITSIFIIISFLDILAVLPSSYSYDLLDLDSNPRIFDATFIIGKIRAVGELTFGSGFGPIDRYTSEMTWRENYPVSNQLWLQILANFGLVGLTFFTLVSFLILFLAPNFSSRLAIISFILSLQLHNFSQKPFFGLLIFGMVYAVKYSGKMKVLQK